MVVERSLLLHSLVHTLIPLAFLAATLGDAAWAATGVQAPDFTIELKPTANGKLDVRAVAPAGHHFNLKAPKYFTWLGAGGSSSKRIAPLSETAKTLEFLVASQNSPRDFEISAYLCDDKETYCEHHSVKKTAPASVASRSEANPQQPKTASSHATGSAIEPTSGRKTEHGFILNDPKEAFRQARAQHRLVMIDFFAIWCPPCNELDEHVFSASKFAKQTADFVRLKLDVDSPVSWRLKSKYGIQGYPTVIFAESDGEEVGRIVGFRPLDTFLADARVAQANREASYKKLRKLAGRGDRAAAAKLGLMEYNRGNWADAKKYLLLSGETDRYGEQLAESEVGLLEAAVSDAKDSSKLTAQLVEVLEKSVRDFPDTPDSIDRRMRLAELYGDRPGDREAETSRKKVLLATVETAQFLMKHPEKLENQDCTPGDLWEDIGDAYDALGDKSAAKQAYLSGAEWFRTLMKSDSERGYGLELAGCLWRAGDFKTAEEIYGKFEKLYPEEFTFFFAHARMDFARKQNAQAQKLAEAAYRRSYGDNRLRVGKLLADIFEAQGEKDQAVAVARKALADVKLPKDSSLRAHRYAKDLKDVIARLAKS